MIEVIPTGYWDNWCRTVSAYLKGNSIRNNFIGHCCELEKKTPVKREGNHASTNRPLCDGDLFLVKFGLLIKTSFVSVDIHALSNDASTLRSGAWHTTVTMDQALLFQQQNIHPQPFPLHDVSYTRVKIHLPWYDKVIEYVSILLL